MIVFGGNPVYYCLIAVGETPQVQKGTGSLSAFVFLGQIITSIVRNTIIGPNGYTFTKTLPSTFQGHIFVHVLILNPDVVCGLFPF